MRAVLGVAVDDGEISAVLVDADVPALGPFDSQRWAASDADDTTAAAVGAVAAMTERAERAGLAIGRIGLVADPAVVDAVREAASVEVTPSEVDATRFAYLANAPELAETPVLAVHTRSGGAETVSVVDVPAGSVLAAVTPDGDELVGYADLLPDAMDEAVARAGRSPQALVFLDLRPGDAGPARELATVLGVPFVTPHGVPWHRATGAALVAARQDAPPPVPGGSSNRGRIAALAGVLVVLLAILGAGLAVAIGGAGESRESEPAVVFDERPVPTSAPPASAGTAIPEPAPCASEEPDAPQVRPASWPARVSDPDIGPAPTPTPAPTAPCP